MVTQEEKDAIAELYANDDVLGTLEAYQDARRQMLEVKGISFPYGPELTQAIAARKEWSEASKRVKELEKEVAINTTELYNKP
jgi:hypothetical protein